MGKASRRKHERAATRRPVSPPDAPRARWRRNLPILRFVALFLVLLVACQVIYHEVVVSSASFRAYIHASARLAATLLGVVGEDIAVSGDVMTSSFSMSLRRGCDGLQAMAILVVAVLVFPGGARRKLVGISLGLGLLLFLNIVRIASLFWAGKHLPGLFQPMHVFLWPSALVFSAVLFWVLWAMRSSRPPPAA